MGDQRQDHVYFFYYYPVGTDAGRPRWPWLTLLLLAGLATVFAASGPLYHWNSVDWGRWVYRPALLDPITPLTAIFLHGSWAHLLGNLLYLWVFAPPLEKAVGRGGLLLVFVGTGYLGNLAQGAMAFHWMPHTVLNGVVGASGAVSGLLGFTLVRFYWARVRIAWWAFLPLQGINRTGVARLPVVAALALWVLLQVVLALTSQGGTAYGAHLGGLATGLLLALALGQGRIAGRERLLASARRARDGGNLHAAVGRYERYVGIAPWDEGARVEYARALRLVRSSGRSMALYRELVQERLRAGRVGEACELWAEGRRGDASLVLAPGPQRRLAAALEKAAEWRGAATAWLDFARFHGGDEAAAEHAMVRSATLLRRRVGDHAQARELLEEALGRYPDGQWAGHARRELGGGGRAA